jgi:DNA-binding MarR family transcriptional regulator
LLYRLPVSQSSDRDGRERGTPASRFPLSCAFLLAQVGAFAASKFAERLAALEFQPQHAGVLRLIGVSGGISQRELAGQLGVFPSRAVALLDELEARGLIERRDDPGDRRSYALHLTERGSLALHDIREVARAHDEAICAGLADDERERLKSLLKRLAEQHGLTPGVHPGFRKL